MTYNGHFHHRLFMPAAIATAHPQTTQAAATVLQAGGNAYDAAVAAMLMSFVTEPLLSSPGGGGFLLACPNSDDPTADARLFDFFSNAPLTKPLPDLDHRPILGDFGARQQEFHIGRGAAAIPGIPAGLHAIHQALCTWELRDLARAAIQAARQGVVINQQQAYVARILRPIIQATPSSTACYSELKAGHVWKNNQLATFLDTLSTASPEWFYQADWIGSLDSEYGGILTIEDCQKYQCHIRNPQIQGYGNWVTLTNPTPSTGGPLIMAQLQHAEAQTEASALLAAMQQAAKLKSATLTRGTTHISVADETGNLACMTLSNGEGNGIMAADWGFMFNNFLGEEDINPNGFFNWPAGQRLPSMMAPTVMLHPTRKIALGTGGSNRIKSTLFLVMQRLMAEGLSLKAAIEAPRMHFEQDHLDLEPGWSKAKQAELEAVVKKMSVWPDHNLYFGGVNAVQWGPHTEAVGDFRRQGSGTIITK